MWGPLSGSRTFFIACVLAFLVVGLVLARKSCNTSRYGLQKGREVHIQDQHLSPNSPDWRIAVPPVCSRIVGVSVTACDVDGAPSVYLSSLTRGMVMRNGRFSSGAFLYVTAYCDPDEEDLYEMPRPPPRYQRPPPHGNRWTHYAKPIKAKEVIVVKPSSAWAEPLRPVHDVGLAMGPPISYTTPWPDESMGVGAIPYPLPGSIPLPESFAMPPDYGPMKPQVYRTDLAKAPEVDKSPEADKSVEADKSPEVDKSLEMLKNVTETTNTTESDVAETVKPERTLGSEEVKPIDSWTAEVEPSQEGEEMTTTANPVQSLEQYSFLRQLALWWLKHVRTWSAARSRRRMWRQNGRRTGYRRGFHRRNNRRYRPNIPRYS